MRIQFRTTILAVAISSVFGLGAVWGQEKKPDWKDRGEYDLVQSITAAQADPNKQLELLNQWKEKYPNTDFKTLRLESYLNTYRALNNGPKMFETAQELLAQDPKNLAGLYWANLLVISMNPKDPSPAVLSLGEKFANTIVGNPDEMFAADKKPAGASDDAWKQTRTAYETIGHRTLTWVQSQRKNYTEAEQQAVATLKLNPNDAEVSYWLGTAILGQKKPERQPDAIYQFARAAAFDGQGALTPDRRKAIADYVKRAYVQYHGEDEAGFQALMATAKANPFAPEGFKILSSEEVAQQKHEQLQKDDPALALWVTLKTALTGEGGEAYFEGSMKGAIVPPEGQPAFKATVISQTPATSVKTLVVAISDAKTPEATLKFETPVPGKLEPGTVIQFRGTASAFSKAPFMVTFDTEKKLVTGWPAPPPKKAAPVRKTTKKKAE